MRAIRGLIVWAFLFKIAFNITGCAGIGSQPNPDSLAPREAIPEPTQTERSSESTADAPISTTEPEEGLWSKLQQAETHYFVLMRHALAPGTGDPSNFQLEDCTTQRNLSEAGRTQARLTGEAFMRRGVSVDRVLSSQWCRCLETADLMEVGPVEPFPPLNSFFRDRSTSAAQTERVREFMLDSQDTPGVTVMVTHFVNISAVAETNLSSGEMVVMHVNEQNQFEVLGQLNL